MEQHASPVLTEQQHHSDTHLTLIRWPIGQSTLRRSLYMFIRSYRGQ